MKKAIIMSLNYIETEEYDRYIKYIIQTDL